MIVTHAYVQDYLRGVSFPIEKGDIVYTAIENEAPEDVLEVLETLPEAEYENITEVMRAITNVEFPELDPDTD